MTHRGQGRDTPRWSVLILEDDWLVALDIAGLVQDAGHEVVGPASTVAAALDLVDQSHVDVALLDINLQEERSYTVAEALDARRIPFAFLSGYVAEDIAPEFRDRVLVNKPFAPEQLIETLETMLNATV